MAIKWGPVNIGLFLPDQATAGFKSEFRFMPVVRSAPTILREMTVRVEDDGRERRVGEGNVLTRRIRESLLMFLWTSGRVTTESRPMDIVSFDEVQEMELAQIDKARARTGDSKINFLLMLSTANFPDLDINFWYQQGTQEVWHTECQDCGEFSDLSDPVTNFPKRSIAFNTGQVPGSRRHGQPPANEYVWTCPHCAAWIRNPQLGRYIAAKAAAPLRSFMLPRTISPRMTPRAMITEWGRAKTGDQKKSFYNRTLARPYIDADQLPVTMAHCLAAAEEGVRAGLTWQKSGQDCFMGIDQMGSFNVIIIKKRMPDGRQGTVHVEAVYSDDPFERAAELMVAFGITCCVVETLPNVNDARRFANRFPRRVYLAGYANLRDDMMVWGDNLTDSDRHTAHEDRTRYTVTLQQYKAMQASLFRVRDKFCLFPDPDLLEQDIIEDGEVKRSPILRDMVFHHLTRVALVVEDDPETRKKTPKVKKVGLDPHAAFANMLCDVAWSRYHGNSMMILPDGEKPAPENKIARDVQERMPGLPSSVLAMIADLPSGTCGRCDAFQDGNCTLRGFTVGAADAGCDLFQAPSS
jgi:hypothetical protein